MAKDGEARPANRTQEVAGSSPAGEVGHWAVLETLNQRARDAGIGEYVEWGLPIQKRHFAEVTQAATALAAEKDPEEVE